MTSMMPIGGIKGLCNLKLVSAMLFHSMIHSIKISTKFDTKDTFSKSEITRSHFGYHDNQNSKLSVGKN